MLGKVCVPPKLSEAPGDKSTALPVEFSKAIVQSDKSATAAIVGAVGLAVQSNNLKIVTP